MYLSRVISIKLIIIEFKHGEYSEYNLTLHNQGNVCNGRRHSRREFGGEVARR
jgi:hypothetical protein